VNLALGGLLRSETLTGLFSKIEIIIEIIVIQQLTVSRFRDLLTVLPFNPDDDYFDMVTATIAAKVGDCGIVEYAVTGANEWTRVDTTKTDQF
jgi:hypothetical protein